MSFAAVICASHSANFAPSSGPGGALRAGLHFAGHSLVEYQVRQAADAGATHILILVSAVTPFLSQAVDRLTADKINVSLIRDMVSLVREAPRDRDMLLIADGAIIAQNHFVSISQRSGNVLLAVDDSRVSAPFERIDGQHRWAGLLRATPEVLFGTLDMLGDWDLELTLMRAVVQAGAHRLIVSQEDILEGRVALIDSQASADLVSQGLLSKGSDALSTDGGAEHYILSHAATRLAPMLLRTQVPASQIRIGGMALSTIGVIAAALGWPVFAILLMLGGLILSLTSDRLGLLARRSHDTGWAALAPGIIALIGFTVIGSEAGALMDGLYLSLLVGVILLAVRWRRTSLAKPWALFTPGSALLVALVAIILSGVNAALAVATLCAIGSIGTIVLTDRKS